MRVSLCVARGKEMLGLYVEVSIDRNEKTY